MNGEELALEIINLSRNTLMIHYRFLDKAIYQLELSMDPTTTLATDGFYYYYNPAHVLKVYSMSQSRLIHDYYHTLLHCIFHHPFVENIDTLVWDLACDIAIEACIQSMNDDLVKIKLDVHAQMILNDLQKELKQLSAEKIYRYFKNQHLDDETLLTYRDYFKVDEHECWYEHTKQNDNQQQSDDLDKESQNNQNSQSSSNNDNQGDTPQNQEGESIKKQWQQISQSMQTDLETLSKDYATKSGTLSLQLSITNHTKTSYHDFLSQFMVFNEEITINDEEFDYIYYTYGLKLYENIPLIEPLEYKEDKKIQDLVIAIDTSASVKEKVIQKLINETYDILLSKESFFHHFNLYLIQCDSQIQDVTVIHQYEELENYQLTMKGFGGTDFRPVFEYIENLQANHELTQLKGLIYLTDGEGIYPQKQPPYKVAFLMFDQNIEVPVWAIKMILEEDDYEYPRSERSN
ncbi:MAG: VWA-like domain-containing protein [Erysipelotrichaceae bacterium]|nr:VWA-like domain-containing protein [Erysipelotrichaceae bacterium]